MKITTSLPSSLLGLVNLLLPMLAAAQAESIQENGRVVFNPQNVELRRPLPPSLRKMPSHDPGQMFHLTDWYFDADSESSSNSSTAQLNFPIFPHSASQPPTLFRALYPRADSGFACPSNTNSCASIGADYGCCPSGTTCQLGGKGTLGCCPGSGGTCAGNTPTQCQKGYTSCALFHGGGGCCAAGFQCQSQGCVSVSTTVVVVHPTVTASRTSSSIVTTTTSTSTMISSSSSSSSSFSSTSSAADTSQDTTPLVPIAPTSVTIATQTSSSPSTITIGPCPTGYYACSAVFAQGACCQIGRDCGRTSCPPLVTSTQLVSNGVTIADVTADGVCATGWTTCAGNVGGGCCPSGYGCGTATCSATATAAASLGAAVAKEGSSVATRSVAMGWSTIAAIAAAALALIA